MNVTLRRTRLHAVAAVRSLAQRKKVELGGINVSLRGTIDDVDSPLTWSIKPGRKRDKAEEPKDPSLVSVANFMHQVGVNLPSLVTTRVAIGPVDGDRVESFTFDLAIK